MGPGERQTPAPGQGVENILGRLHARWAAQTIDQFAHHTSQLKLDPNQVG